MHCATTDGGSLKPTRQIAGKVRINHVYATYQYPSQPDFQIPDPVQSRRRTRRAGLRHDAGRPRGLAYAVRARRLRRLWRRPGQFRPVGIGRLRHQRCAARCYPGGADADDQPLLRRGRMGRVPLGPEIRHVVRGHTIPERGARHLPVAAHPQLPRSAGIAESRLGALGAAGEDRARDPAKLVVRRAHHLQDRDRAAGSGQGRARAREQRRRLRRRSPTTRSSASPRYR